MRRLCRAGRPILARHAPALQWPLRAQLTQAVPTTPRAAAPIAPFARHLCSAHEPQLDPSHMDDEIATGAELEPSAEVLTDAIGLLVEQEAHGVAADSTHDMLLSALLHDTKLHEAVLGYFLAEKSARPSSETYTSLIYVCVKLRRLDDAFRHLEAMMHDAILPDCRTYAHLIKGCGRIRQMKRGETFFRLLKSQNAPEVYDVRVYNAMINMYAHQKTTRAQRPVGTLRVP